MNSNQTYAKHRHGWDCFKTSGGFLSAIELHIPLVERIEKVYRTAYRTGYRNGFRDAQAGLKPEETTYAD